MQRVLAVFLLLTGLGTLGQPTAFQNKIDKGRLLFHEQVDREQQRILDLDGKKDESISLSPDPAVNSQIEYALITRVDALQEKIELDSTLSNIAKVKYIRGLETILRGYALHGGKKDFPFSLAPELEAAYEQAMDLDRKNESIEPVVRANSYGVGTLLIEAFTFPENIGLRASQSLLVHKYLSDHPDEILSVLPAHLDLPDADSLLVQAAHRDLTRFYNFAAVGDRLGARIRSLKDPLVQTISKMAVSRSGQLYYPFIDLLISHQLDFDAIDRVKDDNLEYYRLLVKTRIGYAGQLLQSRKNVPLGMDALIRMLKSKAKQAFIQEINGLHDQPDPVRFKCLEPLTPQEMYYLCVVSEDEIYTSSYLGVFKRIFEKMSPARGDSLIMSVNADYFRKFIKMAAAYNTLDTLLKSMPRDNASTLMRAFMSKLEETTTPANAEDAVDVADSYSSIFERNRVLAEEMLLEARNNYDRCVRNNDRNGIVIYQLEKTLFESADTTRKVDISAQLGIPPIYSINFNSLADDSGRVIQQVFFYGDEDRDGQLSYGNFKALFAGHPEWKMQENEDWLTIKSTRGRPVWIFANQPKYGEDDPDEAACEKLNAFLASKNLHPTIYIHRGHSYHVNSTLTKIKPSARIVVLGSCGGYNNLNEILSISKDAHIISSKQVGTKTVNDPILRAINNVLLSGHNIDWLAMWKDLARQFTGPARDKFDDYIPPYKNLGAIFIKAYRKALNQ